jgi:flagellar motor switch protein FliM
MVNYVAHRLYLHQQPSASSHQLQNFVSTKIFVTMIQVNFALKTFYGYLKVHVPYDLVCQINEKLFSTPEILNVD